MPVRPNLLVIRVAELEVAKTFYEALGLDFVIEKHGSGPEHLSCVRGAFVFEIYPRRSDVDTTSAVRLGFSVPAFDPLLLNLRRLGSDFVTEPKDSKWGRRTVLLDPDGHSVELLEVGYTLEDLEVGDLEELARRDPQKFGLSPALPNWGQTLADRVVRDTRSDSCEVTTQQIEGWWVISASRDWLASPDGSLDLSFFNTAKPLLGQVNACRSEWLIHALANTVVTSGPTGQVVLRGVAPSSSPVWAILEKVGATRSLAFDGVDH